MAVAGEQPDAALVAAGRQPEAVVFDLVKRAGAARGMLGSRWKAGSMKPEGVRRVRSNMWKTK